MEKSIKEFDFDVSLLEKIPSTFRNLVKGLITPKQARISLEELNKRLMAIEVKPVVPKSKHVLSKSMSINEHAMKVSSLKMKNNGFDSRKRVLKMVNQNLMTTKMPLVSKTSKKIMTTVMEINDEDSEGKKKSKLFVAISEEMNFNSTMNFKSLKTLNSKQPNSSKNKGKKEIFAKELNFAEEIKEDSLKNKEGKFKLKRNMFNTLSASEMLPGAEDDL